MAAPGECSASCEMANAPVGRTGSPERPATTVDNMQSPQAALGGLGAPEATPTKLELPDRQIVASVSSNGLSKSTGANDDEEEDELSPLPDTCCSGSMAPNQPIPLADGATANNNGKQLAENEQLEMEQEQDDEETGGGCCKAASCAYYSKQFNRLDPSRRSFSSPAVNLLLFGAGNLRTNGQLQQVAANQINGSTTQIISNYNNIKQQEQEQENQDSGNRKDPGKGAVNGGSSKLALQEKQRRRTALGLISFNSAQFRMSSGSNQSQQSQQVASQKQATTTSTWRHWFTGGGNAVKQEVGGEARKVAGGSRKFLLRGLRPRLGPADNAAANGANGPTREQLPPQQQQQQKPADRFAPGDLRSGPPNHQVAGQKLLEETKTHVADQCRKKSARLTRNNIPMANEEPPNHLGLDEDTQSSRQLAVAELDGQAAHEVGGHRAALELSSHANLTARQQTPVASADDADWRCPVEEPGEATVGHQEGQNTSSCEQAKEESVRKVCEAAERTGRLPGQEQVDAALSAPLAESGLSVSTKEQTGSGDGEEVLERTMSGQLIKRASPGDPKISSNQLTTDYQEERGSLVDRLIDSELEWRQLIREANEELGKANPLESMSEIQLKRQEVIHELVQTERHHCLTLALMRQVYQVGTRQLNEWRTYRDLQSVINLPPSGAISNRQQLAVQLAGNQSDQQAYCGGAQGDLIDLERLFPALEDLIQAHELFFAHLRLRLVESCHKDRPIVGLVGPLGELLVEQFRLQPAGDPSIRQPPSQHPRSATCCRAQSCTTNGTASSWTSPITSTQTAATIGAKSRLQSSNQQANGQKLLQAYAKFCGQHYDSSRYYKQLMQVDKGFKQFIESAVWRADLEAPRSQHQQQQQQQHADGKPINLSQICEKQNPACRQRGIPECNLLVTQRLTKYPMLIEQLIKTSKDDPDEENRLQEALRECKGLLSELNQQLARKESFERLLDIYARFCPKSYTIYNRHVRFTKHDLLQHKRLRQLIHSDGSIRIWSATRRKLFQVLCLILNDIVVFLRVESCSSSIPNVSPHSLQFYQHQMGAGSEFNGADQVDQQQVGQASISQCALISVVASATQSLLSSHHQTHQNNHLAAGAGGQLQSSLLGHSTSNLAKQEQQQPPPPLPLGNNHQQVKYYFANIDNKSSVISLSKLLIREKAVQDGEPRIYLISSSPRQPEMYELAFVSKRHQTGFVDKLKGSIESHNRTASELSSDMYDDYDNNDEDIADDQVGGLYNDVEDDDGENEDECDGDDDDDDDYESEIKDDEDEEPYEDFRQEEYRYNCDRNEAPDYGKPCARNCRRCQQHRKQGHRKAAVSRKSDYFELDIEQDVVQPPPTTGSEQRELDGKKVAEAFSSPEVADSSYITAAYETPNSHADQIAESVASSLSYAGGGGTCGSEADSDRDEDLERRLASTESGLSERAKDSLDETAPSKQKLRGGRRRRAHRPRNVSNQSSSSSEAAHRQAIKLISSAAAAAELSIEAVESAAPAAGKDTCAHEATEDYEFDSGRGHDDSSSAASSSSNSLAGRTIRASKQQLTTDNGSPAPIDKCAKSITTLAVNKTQSQATLVPPTTCQSAASKKDGSKLLDFKLFKDTISLSTSSITSTLMGSLAGSSATAAAVVATPTGCSRTTTDATNLQALMNDKGPPLSGSSASSTASSRTVSTTTTATTKTTKSCSSSSAKSANTTGSGNLVKCSSILGNSSCSFMKQRKLSTVSSMSCQLKQLKQRQVAVDDDEQANLCRFRASRSHHADHAGALMFPVACNGNHAPHLALSKQVRQQLRRSSFVPEQKLEELRDLRIQLDKDKQEWQAKFDRMQEQLLNERRELDLAREKLKLDRQQVANEREQLYRKLDLLREKGILLSPSHKVIITTPELRIYPPTNAPLPNENYQQQVNSRQTLQSLNATYQQPHLPPSNNNTSSVRILQHRQQPHQVITNSGDQSTTNLFIKSSNTCKVPYHLCEPS